MRFVGGLPETACGAGSTLANTEGLRRELPGLLRELGVKQLLDAPCGDCNWISQVEGLPDYIGCDVNSDNLTNAAMRGMNVVHLDIVSETLPPADLMLCRDFHQHLPIVTAMLALDNFRRSGIRWLLATSHDNAVNENCALGAFRPINLTKPPFSLGDPVRSLPDGRGRILGLWQ